MSSGSPEALERTRGLVPSTLRSALWLSCVFVVLVVLVEIGTWFAPRTDGNRRSGCLAALLNPTIDSGAAATSACVLLVRCDLDGTNVPDVLTTTLLLCVLGYGLFVLPNRLRVLGTPLGAMALALRPAVELVAGWSLVSPPSSAPSCPPVRFARRPIPTPRRPTPQASAKSSNTSRRFLGEEMDGEGPPRGSARRARADRG